MRILALIGWGALLACAPEVAQAEVQLTLWSHWAAEKVKRDFVEDAIKQFETENPGVKIKASWYEKSALYAGLKTAIRARRAPDIFYAEPDQVEYIENDLLLDLSDVHWANIEPWAKKAWTYNGKPFGVPLEASTVELYYNKERLKDLGVNLPANLQLSPEAFVDVVRKSRAKGWTPMSLGVGDRSFPGAFLIQEALLKRLGTQDYDRLLKGKLSWADKRVVETLRWLHTVIKAGLLPASFTSLKLGESHSYFYTNPGSVMFLSGSWYTSRAFNPPNQGGQPKQFPLGIMKYPAVPNAVCNECRTLSVQGSFVVNADTKHKNEAIAFLNSLATPSSAIRWLEEVRVQTGVKSDPTKIVGPYAGYFKDLTAVGRNSIYYVGLPSQVLTGKSREVFTQVMNNAFPAGTITVDDAVKQLDTAQ